MARSNPLQRRLKLSEITDDPEMKATLAGSSTLGKQARKFSKADDQAAAMSQWERVDKARAARGKSSLPKPGSKAYRQ